ncbi:MAG: hypothetical protein AABY95_05205 [Pseudomonadota bacterium]
MRLFSKAFLIAVGLWAFLEAGAHVFFADGILGRFDYGYHPTAGWFEFDDRTELRRVGGARFRPQTVPKPKPVGSARVFVVGGSVPRGQALETAYPYKLGEALGGAESYNLGIPGYGSVRSLILMKQALRHDPDVLILHLHAGNEYEDELDWKRAEDFDSWHPRNWLFKSFTIARLYELKQEQMYWKWLPTEIREQAMVHDEMARIAEQIRDPNSPLEQRWQKRIARNTERAVDLALCNGVPLVLVLPTLLDRKAGYVFDDGGLGALAHGLVKRPGVTAYWPADDLRKLTPEAIDPLFFRDGTHMYPPGHAFVGQKLAPVVQQALKSRAQLERQHSITECEQTLGILTPED